MNIIEWAQFVWGIVLVVGLWYMIEKWWLE